MSREIKFRLRGRRNEVIGYEMFHISFGWHHILKSELDVLGGESPIHSGVYKEGIEICYRDQYTGIEDRNGIEIFEGDTTKRSLSGASTTTIGKVYFYKGKFVIGEGDFIKPLSSFCSLEIIENIPQNPELPLK